MTSLDPRQYHIAWFAPLDIEAVAAKHMLDHEHDGRFPSDRGHDYVFIAGDILGHNVVIASLPAGQEYGVGSAAGMVGQVKAIFPEIWFGLLVGVAAGLPTLKTSPPRDIRLGDILVALPEGDNAGLIAYGLGKETSDGFKLLRKGYVMRETEAIIRSAIKKIKLHAPHDTALFVPYYEQMKDHVHSQGRFVDPGQENDRLYESDELGHVRLIDRTRRPTGQGRTQVWYGPIGSGDKLMKNSATRNDLLDEYNIIGLEMEAAGVMNHLPVGVIRGVCDYGDEHKNKDWQPYAAALAAAYAKAVLAQIGPRKTQRLGTVENAPPKKLNARIGEWHFVPSAFVFRRECRKIELAALHRESQLKNSIINTNQIILHGIPGTGKKTLAQWFAHSYDAIWDVIAVIDASSKGTLQEGYTNLAHELNEYVPGVRPEARIRQFLSNRSRVLLILNDVSLDVIRRGIHFPDDMKVRQSLVIITTSLNHDALRKNDAVGDDYLHVEVDRMTLEESHRLLAKSLFRTTDSCLDEASLSCLQQIKTDTLKSVFESVGNHPLSIELVGGCRSKMREHPQKVCDYFLWCLRRPAHSGRLGRVEASFETVYDTIDKLEPRDAAVAYELLHFFAYMGRANFSATLLEKCRNHSKEKESFRSPWWKAHQLSLLKIESDDIFEHTLNDALDALIDRNLVKLYRTGDGTFQWFVSIHPLIQLYARGKVESITSSTDPWSMAIITLAETVSIRDEKASKRSSRRDVRQRASAHVSACLLQQNKNWESWFSERLEQQSRMVAGRKLAFTLYENGQESLALNAQCLLVAQAEKTMNDSSLDQSFGDDFMLTYLCILNDLAITEMELGKSTSALQRRERILEIAQSPKYRGCHSHDAYYIYLWKSNLAKSYRSEYQLNRAFALREQIFHHHYTNSPPGSRELLISTREYAASLSTVGRHHEARHWQETTLCRMRQISVGDGWPIPNVIYNTFEQASANDLEIEFLVDLASNYGSFGLAFEAHRFSSLIYRAQAQVFPEDHISCLLALERLIYSEWRLEGDRGRYLRAQFDLVSKSENRYGLDHPQVLRMKTALAEIVAKTDVEEGDVIFNEVLMQQECAQAPLARILFTKSRQAASYAWAHQYMQAVAIQLDAVEKICGLASFEGEFLLLKAQEELADYFFKSGHHIKAKLKYTEVLQLHRVHTKVYNIVRKGDTMHPVILSVKKKLADCCFHLAQCKCNTFRDQCSVQPLQRRNFRSVNSAPLSHPQLRATLPGYLRQENGTDNVGTFRSVTSWHTARSEVLPMPEERASFKWNIPENKHRDASISAAPMHVARPHITSASSTGSGLTLNCSESSSLANSLLHKPDESAATIRAQRREAQQQHLRESIELYRTLIDEYKQQEASLQQYLESIQGLLNALIFDNVYENDEEINFLDGLASSIMMRRPPKFGRSYTDRMVEDWINSLNNVVMDTTLENQLHVESASDGDTVEEDILLES